jgi:4-amino-4-deoxy-L-arabinose transferase-like glycosyltransferase
MRRMAQATTQRTGARIPSRFPDGWPAAAFVVAAGLVVRLLHLIDLRRLPLFDRPTVDAALYLDLARDIATQAFAYPAVFYKPPLYPYLLATAWRLGGDDFMLLRLPGIVAGAVTCGLVWWIARRLFDARVALVAGLLVALHRTAVYFDTELLEIGVAACLHTAALALVLRADAAPRRRLLALAGLALGLGTIARPTLLVFDAVVLFGMGRRRLLPVLAGLAIGILPATLHNAWHGHDFVLVSSNLGVNFHLGNNPRADGRIAASDALPANPAAAERSARTLAEAAAGRPLRPSQVSSYWLHRGLTYVTQHPGRAVELAIRKLFYSWNAAEISDNEDLAGLSRHLRVLRVLPVGTWLLAPLGLAGLVLAPRRRDIGWLRAFVVAQIAALLPFFIVARFRLVWMPALAVLAAWALVALVRSVRQPQRARGRLWAVLAAAVLVCSVPAFGVRAPVDFDLDYKLGYAWQQRGQLDAALAAYRESVRRHPQNALAMNALGVLLAERGEDLNAAAGWIEKALALDPAHAANYQESLAGVHLKRGDAVAALAACDAGLAVATDASVRAALYRRAAAAHRQRSDAAAEIAALRAALAAAPGDPNAAAARARLGELGAAASQP